MVLSCLYLRSSSIFPFASFLYDFEIYLLINRSPISRSVIVCSIGGLSIAPGFSVVYQWVEMPVRLMATDWRGSLIPYGDGVVNNVPGLGSKEDLLRHLGYQQVDSEPLSLWPGLAKVDTSAAVAKYTPSSSLQPGSLRLDSGQTISTTRLTK